MKKFFLIFLCGGLLLSASAVSAEQKMMVNEDGEVWLIDHVHQWEIASETEIRAYQHPGVEVPINLQIGKPKKVDFFHYIPVQEYSEVIVWNGEKFQTIKKAGEKNGEPMMALHIIFLLAAIIFMTISNIAMKKGRKSLLVLATFVAFAFAFATLVASPISMITFTAFIALILSSTVFNIASVVSADKKKYKIFSVVFYIFSLAAIIIWLTT